MAVLRSEDDESPSSLEIVAGEKEDLYGQKWQHFVVRLKSGERAMSVGDGGSKEEYLACMFCRSPYDEAKELIAQLQELVSRERDRVMFEPAEPSFEFEIARSGTDGITVYAWLDSGNAKTGIYRWDAAGVRFFSKQSHLEAFVEQLKQDFSC